MKHPVWTTLAVKLDGKGMKTLDSFSCKGSKSSNSWGIRDIGEQKILSVGICTDQNNKTQWIARSMRSNEKWNTVDSYAPTEKTQDGKQIAVPFSLMKDQYNSLFALGGSNDSKKEYRFTIRTSSNAGGTIRIEEIKL